MKIRISFCFIRIFDLIARFSARGFDDMTWEFEEKAWAQGYAAVCGVDEAGRGPVAGPVCAAAVILPGGIQIEGLNDSKKLSEKKREQPFEVITENALAWSVSLVDEKTIDDINILPVSYTHLHWAKTFIEYLDQEGIINASATTGNYEPDRDMTRAEFMRYINRAFHFTEEASISFSDVQTNAWYYATIQIAVNYGYINGGGDNRMDPLGEVTVSYTHLFAVPVIDIVTNS